MSNDAINILEKYYGYKSFRKGQEKIINSILSGKDVLAIMPTGGGKSLCYQIPALMLEGMTIVISPLISLMKDQVDAIKAMGIESAYINSSLSGEELKDILEEIRTNKYKIIYLAPERLESYEFLETIKNLNISQVAIDEAHCVSQWGHDFRVSYKRVLSFINKFKIRPIVTGFTATASKEVREDIVKLLGLSSPDIFITGFDRENLSINIIKEVNKKDYLLNYIENNKDECGIIYAATRKEVDSVYEMLKKQGYEVLKYHAGLKDEERIKNQELFIYDKGNIMVATNAFGMGIDKSNIRYVIHYNMPKNIEGYYQEIGRAGRDGEKSECIMLFSQGDIHTQKFLIELSTENPERKSNQYKKLQQIIDFIYCNGCYRKYILNCFGEELKENCNNCSNCLNQGEIVDKTLDAQKVLSCIYRMNLKTKKHFGTTMIIDVLRGSKNQKVTQFNFNEISTYGIMKEYTKESLKGFINTLISHGYISSVEGTYPVLSLNNSSISVLKSEKNVEFKEFKIERKDQITNELFNILKGIRKDIAEKHTIPPYMIFGDGTLREMSLKCPTTEEGMLLISGVGKLKYEKYGKDFEAKIKEYVVKNNISLNHSNKIKSNEEDIEKESVFQVKTDVALLNELIALRKDFAKKENTFPQMIISKQSLKEISGRYPLTIDNLKDISGFGPKKIERYGETILDTVNKYVYENNIDIFWVDKKRQKLIIDGDGRSNECKSLDMLKEGTGLKNISKELEISISTILGYVTEYFIKEGQLDFNLNLENFINETEEQVILEACEKHGYTKISNIKKALPDTIKYESIRAVILRKYMALSSF